MNQTSEITANVHYAGVDAMMHDIIDIFNLDGVDLVRLSGLHRREVCVSGDDRLSPDVVNAIVNKLRAAKVIKFRYTMHCPTCGEVTYQIAERGASEVKLCDTCQTLYTPVGVVDVDHEFTSPVIPVDDHEL